MKTNIETFLLFTYTIFIKDFAKARQLSIWEASSGLARFILATADTADGGDYCLRWTLSFLNYLFHSTAQQVPSLWLIVLLFVRRGVNGHDSHFVVYFFLITSVASIAPLPLLFNCRIIPFIAFLFKGTLLGWPLLHATYLFLHY